MSNTAYQRELRMGDGVELSEELVRNLCGGKSQGMRALRCKLPNLGDVRKQLLSFIFRLDFPASSFG